LRLGGQPGGWLEACHLLPMASRKPSNLSAARMEVHERACTHLGLLARLLHLAERAAADRAWRAMKWVCRRLERSRWHQYLALLLFPALLLDLAELSELAGTSGGTEP
jgi:hypothetical protein